MQSIVWSFFCVFLTGLLDSLKVWYPISLLWFSTSTWQKFRKIIVLDISVLLISIYYIVFVAGWFPGVWLIFRGAFVIFWEIPCFAFLFYFNNKWSSEIISQICAKKYSTTTTNSNSNSVSFQKNYSESLYGSYLVFLCYVGIVFADLVIHWYWLRCLVLFLGYSWLSAYHAFEKRLVYKGYTLRQRIDFFQRRWLYFLGYGAVWGVVYASPWPYRLLYTLYFIMENLGALKTVNITPQKFEPLVTLPIFSFAVGVGDWLLDNLLLGPNFKNEPQPHELQ